MTYDLFNLVGWVRRMARDEVVSGREVFRATDDGEIQLSATGMIQIRSVTADGVAVAAADRPLVGRTLVFTSLVTDSRIVVVYNSASYTDLAILARIVDAARAVGADLRLNWVVNESTSVIEGIPAGATIVANSATVLEPLIETLIVHRAALDIYVDKGNRAADDAILVRDGDTTIDTSKAAASSHRTIERMQQGYDRFRVEVIRRRLMGSAIDDD